MPFLLFKTQIQMSRIHIYLKKIEFFLKFSKHMLFALNNKRL